MKKPILLRQFRYSIPPSVNATAGIKQNHVVPDHLPLMNVAIDFEQGKLNLEGDWHFMMALDKINEGSRLDYHRGRVQIKTDIHDSGKINLNDPQSDGRVFPLEGTIMDGHFLGSCSGVLVIESVRGLNDHFSDQWNISLFLCDLQFNDCEIKLQVPIFITSSNEIKN